MSCAGFPRNGRCNGILASLRNFVRGLPPYFQVRTRLLFSEDGRTALPGKRTHRMRRSFAKGWRNARWRDMLLAFLFWLSDGESLSGFRLPRKVDIKVELPPLMFVSPVSVSEGEGDVTDEDETGEEFTEYDEESEHRRRGIVESRRPSTFVLRNRSVKSYGTFRSRCLNSLTVRWSNTRVMGCIYSVHATRKSGLA